MRISAYEYQEGAPNRITHRLASPRVFELPVVWLGLCWWKARSSPKANSLSRKARPRITHHRLGGKMKELGDEWATTCGTAWQALKGAEEVAKVMNSDGLESHSALVLHTSRHSSETSVGRGNFMSVELIRMWIRKRRFPRQSNEENTSWAHAGL